MNVALIVLILLGFLAGDGVKKNEKGKRNTRAIAPAVAATAIFWVSGIPFVPLVLAALAGGAAGRIVKKDGWVILLSIGAVIVALSLVS
ncbi:hypothetical protein AB0C69_08005 [Actinomadura sp. NPDC048032]|uniref:hypothetical protein n=1 Tax=Actinomadura sp. NPDC048032 TaxID=3155747 RepID=UPI00340C0E1C